MSLRIYHGTASRNDLERCRELAPSYEHGNCWSHPNEIYPRESGYIVDNGAYSAYVNGEEWEPEFWYEILHEVAWRVEEGRLPEPDFVIIPDVVGEPWRTHVRAAEYHDRVPDTWRTLYPVQPGMSVRRAVTAAYMVGADGLFLGGGDDSRKYEMAPRVVDAAHAHSLHAHLGNPSLRRRHEQNQAKGLIWAERVGFDSVDTTSVVTSRSWHHLRRLESQTTFAEVEP